jgi:hypothetical protein
MADGEDDILSLENDFDRRLRTLEDLEATTERLLTQGKVDRLTMESLHRAHPEAIDAQFPIASYTQEPSEQNLPASLESFSFAKGLAVAAVGAVLGALIVALIKMFRSDDAEARAQRMDERAEDIKESDRTVQEMVKEAKKANLSSEDAKLLKAVEENDYQTYTDLKLSRAPRHGTKFLDEVSPGGGVFELLVKWARSINNHYTSYAARVDALADLIGKMYDVEPKDTGDFIKKLNECILAPEDPFFADMGELHDTFKGILDRAQGDYRQFLEDQVLHTHEFYELVVGEVSWCDRMKKITPNGDKQVAKNLDRLEKAAEEMARGKRAEAMRNKRGRMATRVSEDGTFETDAVVTNIEIERAVKEAELAIRSETQFLRMYRHNQERVLKFYELASLRRLNLNTQRNKVMREIINRIPAE